MLSRIGATTLCREHQCHHYPSVTAAETWLIRSAVSVLLLLAFPLYLLWTRPHVVGIHVSSGPSFIRKFGYFCWAKLLRRKVVIHIHPAHFASYFCGASWVERAAIRCVARCSDWTIFLTEGIADSLSPPFNLCRASVIPNFVCTEEYRKFERSDDAASPQLLFMGWIIKEKGVYDIVEAMPYVLEKVPTARFVFAGPKEVDKLRSLLSSRGLESSAAVLGWVSGDEKLKLLASARLLLLPSYSEGIPSVLLEAMAAGLPAITTPVGGIPTVFVDGVNGRFVRPAEPRELAETIVQMLEDEQGLAEMSVRTREHVRHFYSAEAVGPCLVATYQGLFSSKFGDLGR